MNSLISRLAKLAVPTAGIIAGAVCFLSPALAQPAANPDRWSKLGTLRAGPEVRVEMTSGERFAGVIETIDANRFRLRERSGKNVEVERSSVKRITRKSRKRGALYGLLIGFGAGFVTGAAAGPYVTDFGNPNATTRTLYGIGWGIFSGGIGAAIGVVTGARATVYP